MIVGWISTYIREQRSTGGSDRAKEQFDRHFRLIKSTMWIAPVDLKVKGITKIVPIRRKILLRAITTISADWECGRS